MESERSFRNSEKCYFCPSKNPTVFLLWRKIWLCGRCNQKRVKRNYGIIE